MSDPVVPATPVPAEASSTTPTVGGEAPQPGQSPATPAPGDAGKSELTLEQALAELDRTRKEAARYRTERNDLKPLAEKFQEAEDAKKSDAQKAAERIAALEAENQKMVLSSKRAELAAAAGVPVELLRGSTVEELTEHAEALKVALGAATAQATPPAGVVVAGENSGGVPLPETDWLRQQLLRK